MTIMTNQQLHNFFGKKWHLSELLAIVYRKDNGLGWSLFEERIVHGGQPPVGSWIVLKIHKTISDCLSNVDPRIIMIEANEENLQKVRDLEHYANIPCCQHSDDFVRALKSTDGECAVNCDFRLRKEEQHLILELCTPLLLDKENENDMKLMECHNQEIIGTYGDNTYLLSNGMIIWINWLCWVDQLHLLKLIPLTGKIIGDPRNGRYFIPDGIANIDVGCEENQKDDGHYATPAEFPPCEDEFLDMEDACQVPDIPCEVFKDPYDMYLKAEELRKANK